MGFWGGVATCVCVCVCVAGAPREVRQASAMAGGSPGGQPYRPAMQSLFGQQAQELTNAGSSQFSFTRMLGMAGGWLPCNV